MTGILQDLLSLEAEAQQFLTDLQDTLHGIGMLLFSLLVIHVMLVSAHAPYFS